MQEETAGNITAMRPHVNRGSFSRNHCYEAMFLMIKSLTTSLFTRGDCKAIYIDLYRCPKDLYQHFKVYLVPMCFKEIPGVRYSCLKDSWENHVGGEVRNLFLLNQKSFVSEEK